MARYGYKHGEGLGAAGNKGMTRPLEMHAARPGSTYGRIVDRNKDEAAAARATFGEPSEVIALETSLRNASEQTLRDLPQAVGRFRLLRSSGTVC